MNEGHFDKDLQKLKREDSNQVGARMAGEVAERLFAAPNAIETWPFPRKPLGKPTSGKGHSKGKSSKAHSSRSHSKSRTKHKSPSYEGGFY